MRRFSEEKVIRLPKIRGLRQRLVAITAALALLLPAAVGCSGSGADSCPPASYSKAQLEAVKIGEKLGKARFGRGEWPALCDLWHKESKWKVDVEGPKTDKGRAYGIPQALPRSKLADPKQGGGPKWRTDATTQINWGLTYIAVTHGTPRQALKFWHCTTHEKRGEKWVRTRDKCESKGISTTDKKYTWY